jgi:hypothetical protein
MQLRETAPSANMSRSLPTATLAALAHRAEGQCLLEGQAHNSENTFNELQACYFIGLMSKNHIRDRAVASQHWPNDNEEYNETPIGRDLKPRPPKCCYELELYLL